MKKIDRELEAYLDYVSDGMGRPERRRALSWYLTGLLLEGERKTVVSMAGRLVDDEGEVEAMRQRLQQAAALFTVLLVLTARKQQRLRQTAAVVLRNINE